MILHRAENAGIDQRYLSTWLAAAFRLCGVAGLRDLNAAHESKIAPVEAVKIWQHDIEIGIIDAEPAGEGRRVFIDAGGGQPAASADVMYPAQPQFRHLAINVSTPHCSP